MLPHLQGAPLADSELEDVDLCAPVPGKMAIINFKVMFPFLEPVTLVFQRILFEVVRVHLDFHPPEIGLFFRPDASF
jgi:hypothetical protein